jgi:dipeptidyl aminopeptidase/acylaminoacyl peptidase
MSTALQGTVPATGTLPFTNTPPPTNTNQPVNPPTSQPVSHTTKEPVTPTPFPTITPTHTPNPYGGLTIAELSARGYGGGELDIIDVLDEEVPLESGATFSRYLFTYPSDGLDIYGYINALDEGVKFPVAIVLHGYVPPEQYDIVDYTERYATSLVEAGYFVIHPNFRNYPPSDNGPDPFRIGYAIDVLNLIAVIREQSKDPNGYLRRADTDHIHLWGHSMGGGVALRVLTVNTAEYIRAAVLYGSMSGNEQWNYEKIQDWSGGGRGDFELTAPPEMMAAISPIYHLERITAPIAIHHSNADATVPVAWSEDLCDRLEALNQPVECFIYNGLAHTFNGPGDALFMERVIAFFRQY